MGQKKNRFRDLPIKSKLSYGSAILAFTIGWALVIAAFLVEPVGEVHDSILWILGQAMLYAGGVFGIALYTGNTIRGMKRQINRFMQDPSRTHDIVFEEEFDDMEDMEDDQG